MMKKLKIYMQLLQHVLGRNTMYPPHVKTIEDLREWSDGIEPDLSLRWGRLTNEGYKHSLLTECDTDHLENILVTQAQISPVYKRTIIEIIKDRVG